MNTFPMQKSTGSYPSLNVDSGEAGGLAHDPGKVALGLAMAVAIGRTCLADIGQVRTEPALSAGSRQTRRSPG